MHALFDVFSVQLGGINVVVEVRRQRRASVPRAVEVDQPVSPGHAGDTVVQPCGVRERRRGACAVAVPLDMLERATLA